MGRRILAIRPVLRLCLLLPCGRQGLSAKRASHWQVLSTHTERSGDVMFVLGGLAEENMVPIGASFDNGMRNDCHDAVSAELIIPIGVWSSQPAVAAASAEQALEPEQPAGADRPAARGAPQPAVAPSPELTEVAELHRTLREVEEADDTSPDVRRELGKILFMKNTVADGGVVRQYVASRAETFNTIKKLLQRRKDFMAARGLHDGPSHIVGGRYLFTPQDRHQVMKEWMNEFHDAPEQVEQQKFDSWQPQLRPPEGNWGPNTAALRQGMDLRFAHHLQLEAGSKARTSGSPPCGQMIMSGPLTSTPIPSTHLPRCVWKVCVWNEGSKHDHLATLPHCHIATWPHGHMPTWPHTAPLPW